MTSPKGWPRRQREQSSREKCGACGAWKLPRVRCACTFREVPMPARIRSLGAQAQRGQRVLDRIRAELAERPGGDR